MGIIRKDATKESLKCEIRDLKDVIHYYDLRIKNTSKEMARQIKEKEMCQTRLIEMQGRYNNYPK